MELLRPKKRYLEVFVISLIIALSFLLPYIIIDKGIFVFYGDYNVQQVPFYMLVHQAIRSGNTAWSWTTDLGANLVGSYAFYNMGSPFFWLTIPLPNALVPYTLGPLLALKMAVASVGAYAFIGRFVKREEIAAIGGLLYAFSGFSIYNIFYNHFHEPMCLFPFLLIGLEEFMKHDRKGLFALAVFLDALVNYEFFIGTVFFIALYFILRMISGAWKLNIRKFLLLAFESVLGVGLACILFIPAVLAVMGNYRVHQPLQGWYLLLYDNNQRYGDILHSLFFPQDLPARPNFFPNADKWSSISAFLPFFSCSGVLAFIIAKKGHWLKRILCISLLIALVPGLNSMFIMFNSDYYARWFFMPTLLMSLATCIALDDPEVDYAAGLKWTIAITLIFTLTIGLIPKKSGNKITQIGLEDYPLRFWAYVVIVLVGLALLVILLRFYKKNSPAFLYRATIILTLTICIYANFFIATGKKYGEDGAWYKSVAVEGASKLTLNHTQFSRIDVYNGMDNLGMFWNWPTIQAFQSVVPTSIMKFYQSVGVQRDVASRPDLRYIGLRSLLSVKYLVQQNATDSFISPGWVFDSYQNGMKVWRNTNFIPMGFTYSSYVNSSTYEASQNKDLLLVKGILLSTAQIQKYGRLLTPLPISDIYETSTDQLAADSAARRVNTCSTFTTNNQGFLASITLPKDNLVFFSVPYDSGWHATVNGKPAKIEEVNVGFMAVKCDTGNNTIRFTYTTPGLATGQAVTGISIAILVAYLLFARYSRSHLRQSPLLPSRSWKKNIPQTNHQEIKEEKP
ncbi:MAG: YfhO family protein [Ethanoligenens sp.]